MDPVTLQNVWCVCFAPHPATQIMVKLPIEKTIKFRLFTNVGIFSFFHPNVMVTVAQFVSKSVDKYLSVSEFVQCILKYALMSLLFSSLNYFRGLLINMECLPLCLVTMPKTFVPVFTASKISVDWRYIFPRTPHQCGLWEATIKSAKTFLLRATNGQIQTIQKLYKLFTQIEEIMNSRAIKDGLAVTLGHFLVGDYFLVPSKQLNVSAALEITPPKFGHLWEIRQRILWSLWKQWRANCLKEIHIRGKWLHGYNGSGFQSWRCY